MAVSPPLATRRALPQDRQAAGARDHWRTHHLLVPRTAKTETSSRRMKKLRLDELLVARGLADSRTQAKALIMTGRVRHGTDRLDKPGKEFPPDFDLTIDQPPRFVSRGGEKLAAALERFALDLRGAHVLDV